MSPARRCSGITAPTPAAASTYPESGRERSAAFTPAEAPAAPWSSARRCPWPLARRALFRWQTFGFCRRQETGATLSKSSRRRWWGSEGGGMSEPRRGRDRGRRAQRTASARGEAVAPGVPARIPAWETGPAGLSATRDLTKLQQQKRREGRGGRGTRSRRGSELALFV